MSGPDYDFKIQRNLALVRDGGRCRAEDYGLTDPCSTFPPGVEVHHRNRRRGPDPHALEWLVTLCPGHHAHAHAHPEESYANGLLVRSGPVESGLKQQHETESAA